MAVNSLVNKKTYNCNGSVVDFSFNTFAIYEAADLSVYLLDTDGNTTTLTLNTDYTVTLDSTTTLPSTGKVTTVSTYATGNKITVKVNPAQLQALNFVDGEATPAFLQNKSLDLLTLMVQSLQEQIDRAVLSDPSSTTNFTFPSAVAGYYLAWNSDASALESVPNTMLITPTTVSGSALTSLGSIPVGAGLIPNANIAAITTASKVSGAALYLLANIPVGAGIIPAANLTSVAQKGANSDITSLTACTSIAGLTTITRTGDLTVTVSGNVILYSGTNTARFLMSDAGAFNLNLGGTSAQAIEVTHVINTGNFFVFHDSDSVVGSVSFASNTTAYNTTSDARLKSNIEDFTAIDIIRAIKPKKYNRVKSNQKEYGFIAQDVYSVFPQAVTVGGDNAKTSPWMMDNTKFIPLLCQGLIEEDKDIDKLRKRVKHLEDLAGVTNS